MELCSFLVSNVFMIRPSLHVFIFLNLLLVANTMATTIDNSQCCDHMDFTHSEVDMPCNDSDGDTCLDNGKCFTSSFGVLLFPKLVTPSINNADKWIFSNTTFFITSTINPPYRPPITHLS